MTMATEQSARRRTGVAVRTPPAAVDGKLGQVCGQATRAVMRREFEVFGNARFERLAGISTSHLGVRRCLFGGSLSGNQGNPLLRMLPAQSQSSTVSQSSPLGDQPCRSG